MIVLFLNNVISIKNEKKKKNLRKKTTKMNINSNDNAK